MRFLCIQDGSCGDPIEENSTIRIRRNMFVEKDVRRRYQKSKSIVKALSNEHIDGIELCVV